jgi:hypothetical protein
MEQGTANEDEWQELLREAIARLLRDGPAMLKYLPNRGMRKTDVADVQC